MSVSVRRMIVAAGMRSYIRGSIILISENILLLARVKILFCKIFVINEIRSLIFEIDVKLNNDTLNKIFSKEILIFP